MLTGDQTYIKKINRSVILGKIIENGMISRADLSKITGLNKATISVQVSDLLNEELIIETQQEHKNLGRRPIMLSINHQAGFALGIDLDKNTITFRLTDLRGYPVTVDVIELQSSNYQEILALLVKHIKDYQTKCSYTRYGLVEAVIGIHGIVNTNEMIYFVPQHKWQNKNLKDDIKKEIEIDLYVENNANLCSYAEQVYKHQQSKNLLCVSISSGIGLGILANGEFLKGYNGYAGEIGHMIVVPDGIPCSCGNLGCWEQYASESSFFAQLSQKQTKQNINYRDIKKWVSELEPNTMNQLEQFIKYVSIGLNNIINLYNPEILVVNCELLQLYPDAIIEIKKHLTSTISHYQELLISELGNKACAMGACSLAIKNFLDITELSLTIDEFD
ncbi:ROK family protein [Fodinisporobacter ferrooxydans]|uniref:ROK family protein n=1 Tax=Fodinisporobacter ferrooxydans TaxID=2901836 RepID=A0ABY4CIP6_9BACL|nr:ROK family protein [Alicyclobacillaceae bacterium MYW30-H2]